MTWDQYARGDAAGPSGPSVPPMPSEPPPAPADPLRAAGAALLNLSGLGLGYLLLRRWGPLTACLAATAALLVTALPADTDGVPLPLVVLYALVLATAAAHGYRLALRRRLTFPARGPVALTLGVVLLAVPAGGTLMWSGAHDEAVQRMLLDRLGTADHLVAGARTEGFPTAQHAYRTAFGLYRDLADHHAGSRAAARVPARLTAFYQAVATPYTRKDYCTAIAPLTYLRSLPSTAGARDLAHWPDDRLATAYYGCGIGRLTAPDAEGAATPGTSADGGNLARLLSLFPGSAQAHKVAPALTALIHDTAAGLPGRDPCGSRDRLDLYRTTATSLTALAEPLAGARDAATRGITSGTYDCGLAQYRAADFDAALATMNAFAKDHPHDGRTGYAKKVAIAADIATGDPAAGRHLPSNAAPGGAIPVTFTNAGPDPVTVYYTGAVTGSLSLPACGTCHTLESEASASGVCRDERNHPRHTLHLPAGTTYFMQHASGDTNTLDSHTHATRLTSGYEYTECAYVVHEDDGFTS